MSTYNDYDAGSMVFDDLLFGINVEVDYEITETWREDYEGDGSVPNGINREAMKNLTSITGEWVVYVIEGDEKAGVNEMGGVWRHRQADSVAQDARGGE